MSRNTERESDHVVVGGKAPVCASEKQLLGDLYSNAVPGWGAACDEIRLPKGKVGSPRSF